MCQSLAQRIAGHRADFFAGIDGMFYTLGNALYQTTDTSGYWRKASISNKLLFESFASLYDIVLTQMSLFLRVETGFAQDASLPGFHLFEFRENRSYPGGGGHFDLSHLRIFPPGPSNYYQTQYSFTLPLELPAAPCGLDIWELPYNEMSQYAANTKAEDLAQTRTKYFIPYNIGELVVFRGDYFHQISPINPVQSGERRITFQGHCLFHGGNWKIYF